MPYTAFTNGKPVLAPDTGAQVIDFTRNNLAALRDAIVVGRLKGWNMTVTAEVTGYNTPGTAQYPDQIVWANGTLRVGVWVLWGTAGGAQYNPTALDYYFSSDSGGTWDPIGLLTVSYDSNGNPTASVWS